MFIDAHQHFWRPARGDYGWLTPDSGALYRDYAPADLEPLLAAAGVEASVLVQAAPSEAETDYLLSLAADAPFVRGIVGWCDLEAPDAPARVAALAAWPPLKGLRPMIQDIADDDWMLGPGPAAGFAAMAEVGLTLDALARPRHLPRLTVLADRFPNLSIVLDHAGKPDIAGSGYAPWAEAVGRLAERPNVACKVSGLLTEAAPGAGDGDLAPYAARLLETFAPRRLLWGSDWPVLTLAGDYAGWATQARRLFAGLSDDERAAIFGGTAARIYNL